jgi:hypothetical protein
MSTLTSDFDTGIPTEWTTTGTPDPAQITSVGGAVRIAHTAAPQVSFIYTENRYSLIGDSAYAEVTDYGNQSLASHYFQFIIETSSGDQLFFSAQAGSLHAFQYVSAVSTEIGTGITLDLVTHRWLRIREAGGTTFWDTAPDGLTWTNRWSVANPTPLDSTYPFFISGGSTEATGTQVIIDNFNTVPSIPPLTARPFHVVQEYFHDAGTIATNETLDLQFDAASFKAVLTSLESNYLAAHHLVFVYFCLPHNLIRSSLGGGGAPYNQTLDVNYVTTMQGLATTYGIDKMFIMICPEWDNDPGNNGWAQNRFLEAGANDPDRPDLPGGLTRQQAYDQWNHFYLANNHGGNTNHHQLGQILSVAPETRGYKTQSNNVNAGTCFYSYEMGIDQVTLQRNNDDIGGLVGSIGFIRGAATQYGKTWGIDTSHSRTYGPLAGVTSYSGSTLIAGWSAATYKRHYYLSYAIGSDVLMEEAADHMSGGTTNINGRNYTPFGVTLRDFCNCAIVRHPQRGIPHVPIAIMKDHISNLEPRFGQWNQGRGVWIQQMSANNGENMVHNLLDLLYPNYATASSSTTTAEPWGTGRWGEQFDFLTEKCSAAVMSTNYRVVMLSTNATMDATLQTKLDTFVQGGGILVINAKQLTGTAHQTFTGVTVTGTASTSGTVTWDSDSSTTSNAAFNYTTVTLGTATVLAHSGASTPQVTKNVVGAGEVWTVLPDYMSNTSNNATLALATKLIQELITRFAVATISGGNHADIDYAITTQAGADGTATMVTIINTSPSNTTGTGVVSVPGSGTPVREWISDTTPSSSVSGGNVNITASVPANDVRVYAVG